MAYLLNLVYLVMLIVVSPWLLFVAVTRGKYREGFAAKFLGCVSRRSGSQPCIWLHAVSVGEVNLLGTLIAQIERQFPEWQCVISTTTMTGLALAKSKYAPRTVFYCPLDFSWAVRWAMRRVRPNVLVLAELELWPNLIWAARRHGAKVAVVNARLSDRSLRGYRRIKPLVGPLLRSVDLLAVQNRQYAARFLQLGARSQTVHVTGSLKFDGAQTDRNNPVTRRFARLAGISTGDIVFVAGSTQESEEALALAAYRRLSADHPRLRLILVPRHPDRFDAVAEMLDRSEVAWQRRSRLEEDEKNPAGRVLLVDAIGELGAWWGTAHVAFVGGSMGSRGGQNMIEPAAYGAAVSFGPNTHNFREIVAEMLTQHAAVVVHDVDELTSFVRRALEEHGFADRLGRQARSLVAGQLGATGRTVELVGSLMHRVAPTRRRRNAA